MQNFSKNTLRKCVHINPFVLFDWQSFRYETPVKLKAVSLWWRDYR